MIAISGLLVVVAFVTLILGVFQSGLGMIYVSIAASVAAAVSLATGVVRSRPKAVSMATPEPVGTWGGTATPVLDRPADEQGTEEVAPLVATEEPTTRVLRLDQEEEEAEPEAAPAPAKTASRARKTTAAKSSAAKTSGASAGGNVVVVPGRDKFHKDSCRYAKGQVTQSITKAAAKREGYKACGVCKP